MRRITVDNVEYKVNLVYATLTRKFSILEGDQGGMTLDGTTHRDILGTNYEYELGIEQDLSIVDGAAEYDALYQVLTRTEDPVTHEPIETHTVSFPYGQGTITFDAMITDGQDTYGGTYAGIELWTGLKIHFTSRGPAHIVIH